MDLPGSVDGRLECDYLSWVGGPERDGDMAKARPMTTRPIPVRPGPHAARARMAEILRVDHAGELGAVHIYRGQRAVLEGAQGRDRIAGQLAQMESHEAVHLARFARLLT